MTIDNKDNLILKIDGKTKCISRKEIENAFSEPKTFCANYSRDNVEEEKPLKKVYLAIPYSGMEESSYEQATKATMLIINEMGHNVFSPITHSHPVAKLGVKGTWDYWQKIDYQYLDWADEMWVLIPKEGLTKVLTSTGVVAETKYAIKNNKKVRFITINGDNIIFI